MSAVPTLPSTAARAAAYLALGDSYTIGQGVAEAERWPVLLATALRARGIDIAPPVIVATSGWTTDELSRAIDDAETRRDLHPPYALVSLAIGVNDQYRGRPPADYAAPFRALLARAIALAGGSPGRVFVPSIPDWGRTPFAHAAGRNVQAVSAAIDAYNAIAAAVCAQQRVRFIDITTPAREPAIACLLVDDGLHPDAAQYRRWVEWILARL